MSSPKPLVYVILGATGSGRREIVADLIDAGLATDESARPVVLMAEDEPASEFDSHLPARAPWSRDEGGIVAEHPPDATHLFFIADGRGNPIDQLEALKPWLAAADAELGRIICVVNCRLAEAHPPLLAWYDACIHFSDIVLLHQRQGVENRWISDFLARYREKFYPCLFETVKQGRIKNPALVLEPQARRMSHSFDEEVDWVVAGEAGADEDVEDGEVDVAPEVDPYFERRPGGRRVIEIPDIARFLNQPGPSARA